MLIVDSEIELETKAVNRIKRINTQMYNTLKDLHTLSYLMIWSNPENKPEDIIAEFGTDGKTLFEISAMVQSILKKVNPEYRTLELHKKREIVINEDGSVVIVPEVVEVVTTPTRVLGENEQL